MNNKVKIAFAMGTFIIVSLMGYQLMQKNEDVVFYADADVEPIKIVVYVVGEVNEPGIFEVEDGTRVHEVLEMAGGVTEDADVTRLNLAKVLVDEEKINVPKRIVFEEETKEGKQSSLVNINTANVDTLSTLSGIGKSTAQKIIQYRNENGYFDTIEDIMNVSGIGENKFNAIKDNITV